MIPTRRRGVASRQESNSKMEGTHLQVAATTVVMAARELPDAVVELLLDCLVGERCRWMGECRWTLAVAAAMAVHLFLPSRHLLLPPLRP